MSGDTTEDLHGLIERVRQGDGTARRLMLDRVYHRLRAIAAATFRTEFPRLRNHHELDSIVDEAWARLVLAIESHPPGSVESFYGLVFLKVRQVLFDMARGQSRHDRHRGHAANGQTSEIAIDLEVADDTHEPSHLAVWTEFHTEVAKLPETERLVFDLHYLGGYTQAEVAKILSLHPKQVSRSWLAATGKLALWLDGFPELV
jgi:RNA polymerase sigma factor (sigma-70 family)